MATLRFTPLLALLAITIVFAGCTKVKPWHEDLPEIERYNRELEEERARHLGGQGASGGVPTLSEWGLLILGSALVTFGLAAVRRARQ